MSTTPSPKEIGIRWFTEVWNNRNTAIIPDLMNHDAKGHLEGGQEIVGPEQFIQFQKAMFEALPDIRVDILNSLSDGDDACILWRAHGTHSGQGLGFSPTGKSISFRGMTWLHVVDGKITEGWDAWDQGSLISRLATPA
ncbi:MAG TPA: ester cyclase [Chthoniobacterales bacterium]